MQVRIFWDFCLQILLKISRQSVYFSEDSSKTWNSLQVIATIFSKISEEEILSTTTLQNLNTASLFIIFLKLYYIKIYIYYLSFLSQVNRQSFKSWMNSSLYLVAICTLVSSMISLNTNNNPVMYPILSLFSLILLSTSSMIWWKKDSPYLEAKSLTHLMEVAAISGINMMEQHNLSKKAYKAYFMVLGVLSTYIFHT